MDQVKIISTSVSVVTGLLNILVYVEKITKWGLSFVVSIYWLVFLLLWCKYDSLAAKIVGKLPQEG